MKKIVVAQKTALGQVQVSTILVKEDDETDDANASKAQLHDTSKVLLDDSQT